MSARPISTWSASCGHASTRRSWCAEQHRAHRSWSPTPARCSGREVARHRVGSPPPR
jgi:hypothetical protein